MAGPVRFFHRLNSFRPRRQVLSLSCGEGCLGRPKCGDQSGFFMVALQLKPIQARKLKRFHAAEQNGKGSVPTFKVNKGLADDNLRAK